MPVDPQWLGRGWYEPERHGDDLWIWSKDVAEIDPRGADRIDLRFFSGYAQFTKRPQQMTVIVDGSVQSSNSYFSGDVAAQRAACRRTCSEDRHRPRLPVGCARA